ncbi:hypothetical protein IFM89_010874 [Coptis chinensis]|uniref:Uncharacterized protein n=1 Tax=Coptis chinensis TaxID=261450 RepID=A0A835I315_9MAGN|nr:hypothetical protein IFM89_010874 [Coptis chinensis]
MYIEETVNRQRSITTDVDFQNINNNSTNFNLSDFDFIDSIPLRKTTRDIELWDFGEPNKVCSFCGAILWNEERNNKKQKGQLHTFSICCQVGKIQLPLLKNPPQLLKDLHESRGPRSTHFIENIRSYNSIFAFTSMGGKIDYAINNGGGPYVFRIHGQNYHKIGSLLPT